MSINMTAANVNDPDRPGGIFTQIRLSSHFCTFPYDIRTPSLLTPSFNILHSPGRVAMTYEYM
jgi:hypothetical protein